MAKRMSMERLDAMAQRSAVVSLSDYENRSRPAPDAGTGRPAPTRDITKSFRVLAVLDGTRESSRLLDYIIGMRESLGGMDVVMIHCYQPAFWKQIGPLANGHRNVLGEMTKRSRQFASRKLAAAQIKQSHRMILGDPTATILKQLEEQTFDMVLLAGRDHGSAHLRALSRVGLTLDALPSRVMRSTEVPVCVIR